MSTPNNATGVFTSGPPNVVSQPVSVISQEISSVGPNPVVVTTSQPPTTTVEAPSSAPATSQGDPGTVTETPSVVVVTTAATSTDSNNGATSVGPQTVIRTSTASGQRSTDSPTRTVTTSSSARSSSGAAALASSTSNPSPGGLSAGSKIAVAVVVPVAAVAIIVLLAIVFWRKRKQRKEAEDLRRKEVEEYGFNPNNDPTLPVVGGASSNGDEGEMTQNDSSGYRGWGTTSTARKGSTTLSSGNGPIGVARSTSGSENGRYTNGSPTGGTNKSSDAHSNDPLVGNGRPTTGDSETIGALGAVPSNDNRQNNMNRGPSNASSAYSNAHRSDTSGEGGIPGGAPGQQYYNDGLYYDEGMPQHGPYGDGSYGGAQPVIRDVPARRNTRIENPSVLPPQGSAGIAQNF